jgi:hypothetical protein
MQSPLLAKYASSNQRKPDGGGVGGRIVYVRRSTRQYVAGKEEKRRKKVSLLHLREICVSNTILKTNFEPKKTKTVHFNTTSTAPIRQTTRSSSSPIHRVV